jgi:hypothetical protein
VGVTVRFSKTNIPEQRGRLRIWVKHFEAKQPFKIPPWKKRSGIRFRAQLMLTGRGGSTGKEGGSASQDFPAFSVEIGSRNLLAAAEL